jgi:8-oxo-dGTP pyrophosphatase MutT (NUDIX family)
MAEYWDLYDDDREPLGRTIQRGKMTSLCGEYHVVVMIMTMNTHGQLLCTLRSPDKATYPNLWEVTAGSAIAGEDSLTAAKRELFEETGIVAGDELEFVQTVKENSAFIDCYFLRRDVEISQIRLQDGETVKAKWVGKTEFENMIAQKKMAFPVARRYVQLYDFLMQEGFI